MPPRGQKVGAESETWLVWSPCSGQVWLNILHSSTDQQLLQGFSSIPARFSRRTYSSSTGGMGRLGTHVDTHKDKVEARPRLLCDEQLLCRLRIYTMAWFEWRVSYHGVE